MTVDSVRGWSIRIGAQETRAVWEPSATGATDRVFICAHGAGGGMNDRAVLAAAQALGARGLAVVRFDFLYRASGSGRPDPMPKLLACWEAVIEKVREELQPRTLIIGGRSMGGRAATMLPGLGPRRTSDLASERPVADGLLLLAYPLHPPGQPEKIRDAHLDSIGIPVLCFNGTRDPFCEPALMNRVAERLGPNWQMHWLESADHSFHVLKRSGRTDRDVLDEVGTTTEAWLARIR